MFTIHFYGPLRVTLDHNGRVQAVESRIDIPISQFSPEYIQIAQASAVLAFESTLDCA